MAIFKDPRSSTLHKTNPQRLNLTKDISQFSFGEVIDVNYSLENTGVITFRTKHEVGSKASSATNKAIPLFPNQKSYPVRGELVLLISMGTIFYVSILNILNNINCNQLNLVYSPSDQETAIDMSYVNANKTFNGSDAIPATQMYEGDIVYEGRFGQSIKFGSTNKTINGGNAQNNYSESDLSENGDPILIIRNGIKSNEENIQKDLASDYYCSTQAIQIDNNKNGFSGITEDWSTLSI